MNGPVLRMIEAGKSYDSPAGPIEVLRGIDLEVMPGESVSIAGSSGSGKSTLLNIAGCLDTPTNGTVELCGKNSASLSESEKSNLRNQFLGFVFQLHHLLPQCTVLENVLVPTLVSKSDVNRLERARELLELVGLADRADHRPAELSGGECLRAAIARGLVNQPTLLLADEPTGSLDEKTSRTVGDLLFDINRTNGTALVLVTHSPSLASRAGTVYDLHDGKLKMRAADGGAGA